MSPGPDLNLKGMSLEKTNEISHTEVLKNEHQCSGASDLFVFDVPTKLPTGKSVGFFKMSSQVRRSAE